MTPEALLRLAHEILDAGAGLSAGALAEGYLALSAKLEAAEQERDAKKALLDSLTNADAALASLRALQDFTSRGEVVKACPQCKALEPEWQPESACYYCHECCTHFDNPANWQRVERPT